MIFATGTLLVTHIFLGSLALLTGWGPNQQAVHG